MPSAHKHSPVPFRPPEEDRAWLFAHAEETGLPVNRILAMALAAYREMNEPGRRGGLTHPDRVSSS